MAMRFDHIHNQSIRSVKHRDSWAVVENSRSYDQPGQLRPEAKVHVMQFPVAWLCDRGLNPVESCGLCLTIYEFDCQNQGPENSIP